MKNLIVVIFSLTLIACGGSDGGDGSSDSPGSTYNAIIGQYQANIYNGPSVVRSFNVTIVDLGGGSYRLLDNDNPGTYYDNMSRTFGSDHNYFVENGVSEAFQIVRSEQTSISNCIDIPTTGSPSGSTIRLSISTPKFVGGGPGTSLKACKLY